MSTTKTFGRQHAGPPFAVNGGHTAGVLAETAYLTSGHVEFVAPVPLETPIRLEADNNTATLSAGERALARIVPVSLLGNPAPSVDWNTAEDARLRVDPSAHPFPDCYVCGPHQGPDGLHLLPGRVGPGLAATTWTPTPRQAHRCGAVPLRVVTAALDCPSAFSFLGLGEAALLAAMDFEVVRLPQVGEPVVVTASHRRSEGRKAWATTVLSTPDGATLARAENLWIRVDAAQVASMATAVVKQAA